MALGSTQPLTGMCTRNLPGGKRRPVRKADNLTAICEPTVYKMWKPRLLTTLWAFTVCYRDSFTFLRLLSQHCTFLGTSIPQRTLDSTWTWWDDGGFHQTKSAVLTERAFRQLHHGGAPEGKTLEGKTAQNVTYRTTDCAKHRKQHKPFEQLSYGLHRDRHAAYSGHGYSSQDGGRSEIRNHVSIVSTFSVRRRRKLSSFPHRLIITNENISRFVWILPE
jgi:hypothetical protein